MIDWLKKRLTRAKGNTQRWPELAEAIQEFWAELFDPAFLEVRNLRSIYTASQSDQLKIAAEMGRYFESDLPEENVPVSISQRRIEIAQKDTFVPIASALRRMSVEAEWVHLWGKSGEIYGTRFYKEDECDPAWFTNDVRQLDGAWSVSGDSPIPLVCGAYLTSRGVLRINLANVTDGNAVAAAIERVRRIKPLHIVFDGVNYFIDIELDARPSASASFFATLSGLSRYPWCSTRLDGLWPIGTDARNITLSGQRVDGSWAVGDEVSGAFHEKIRQCNLLASAGYKIIAERPAEYLHAKLSESLLKLNGGWSVGDSRILALSGGPNVSLSHEADAGQAVSVVHAFSATVDYPSSPTRLATKLKLSGRLRLNGGWPVGRSVPNRVLSGWKVGREIGVRCSSATRNTVSGLCGLSNKLGRACYRIGEWWAWRLNGAWKVKMEIGRLAPKIGEIYRTLNGGWQLGNTKKLGDLRIGCAGPDCFFELAVRTPLLS